MGVNETQQRLRALDKGMSAAAFKGVSKAAKRAEREIKISLKTGRHGITSKKKLRQSFTSAVKMLRKDAVGVVGSPLIYARIHEYGSAELPGGVVRPTKSKYLTIPFPNVKPGRKASDFQDAFVIKVRGNLYIVRTAGNELEFLFSLRKSVKIPARHYVSKTVRDIEGVIFSLINREVGQRVGKAQKSI